MRVTTLLVHNAITIRILNELSKEQIRKKSSEGALNSEFYLSDWHFKLTQLSVVLLSSIASDMAIKPGGRTWSLS